MERKKIAIKPNDLSSKILIFIGLILLFTILKVLKQVVLPVVIAGFLFAAVNPLLTFFKKIKIPNGLAMLLSMVVLVLAILLLVNILIIMTNVLVVGLPKYVDRINEVNGLLSGYIIKYIDNVPDDFSLLSLLEVDWYAFVMGLLTSVSTVTLDIISDIAFILLFVFFMLLEQNTFIPKIVYCFNSTQDNVSSFFSKANKQLAKYIVIKVIISGFTGLFFYLTAIITGLDFAIVWGVLAFFLNFIPTIGSIVVTALTVVMAIVQFLPDWTKVAYVLVLTILTQQVWGNIIDPKLQGEQLNLSPLVILVALTIWSYIWGIAGMFLAVPIVAVVQLLCSVSETTRPLAVFLSTGKTFLVKDVKKVVATERKDDFDFVLPVGNNPEEDITDDI